MCFHCTVFLLKLLCSLYPQSSKACSCLQMSGIHPATPKLSAKTSDSYGLKKWLFSCICFKLLMTGTQVFKCDTYNTKQTSESESQTFSKCIFKRAAKRLLQLFFFFKYMTQAFKNLSKLTSNNDFLKSIPSSPANINKTQSWAMELDFHFDLAHSDMLQITQELCERRTQTQC